MTYISTYPTRLLFYTSKAELTLDPSGLKLYTDLAFF